MGRLGEFEMAILFSILRAGDDAYGLAIRDAIQKGTGRTASPGAIYTTLGRLEERGLVQSYMPEGQSGRAGRPRKYYRLTRAGAQSALQAYRETERLADGLVAVLSDLAEE